PPSPNPATKPTRNQKGPKIPPPPKRVLPANPAKGFSCPLASAAALYGVTALRAFWPPKPPTREVRALEGGGVLVVAPIRLVGARTLGGVVPLRGAYPGGGTSAAEELCFEVGGVP